MTTIVLVITNVTTTTTTPKTVIMQPKEVIAIKAALELDIAMNGDDSQHTKVHALNTLLGRFKTKIQEATDVQSQVHSPRETPAD